MNRADLLNFILKSFNDDELRDLCFILNVNYEDLGGEGRSAKARELVAHCERHGQLAELESTAQQLAEKYTRAPDPLVHYLHQLPSPPNDFVGREAEQQELLNMIERGAVITGLRGMGGIGKTALGLIIAHQLKARYPDAQFFLDLRGAGENPVTPLDALTHVVRAFYPTSKLPDSLEEMQKLYLSELEGKRALVFFDNAKDARQVVPLLPPASCLLLITSRAHFTLPGLRAKDLNVLPPDQARELVLSIAERLTGVILSRSEAQAKNLLPMTNEIPRPYETRNDPSGDADILVADLIAQLCGCLPQALRASASLLAETIDLDPNDYVRQLRDERQRLQRIGLDPARNLDMEASLNLSYAMLSADEQRVFARLSVFPTDFDAAAEEANCEDEGHAHLSRLVKLSLVQYVTPTPALPRPAKGIGTGEGAAPLPSPAPAGEGLGMGVQGRYSLHDLVRLFADGHLSDDERLAAQRRYAEHYERVLRQAKELYKRGHEFIAQGLAVFDREWPNIQAGQQWATLNAQDAGAAQLCNTFPDAGAYVLELRLHPHDRIRWLQDALAAARHLKHREAEGVHLGSLGVAHASLGETRRAIQFYEQSLAIRREIEDRHGEGNVLGNLGNAYYSLGVTRQAIEFYKQQLAITREIGDRRGEGSALGNLGSAYHSLGETRKAIEFHEQALVIMREIGDKRAEGSIVGNLGSTHHSLGETRKAIEFHEQALVIKREIGDRRGEGTALGNLGSAYHSLGETRKAIEFYEQHRDIAREIGDQRGEGTALWNMALALDEVGKREQAIAHAEAALKIFEAIEDPWAEKMRQRLAKWRQGDG